MLCHYLFTCVADGKPLKAVITLDGCLADVIANVADGNHFKGWHMLIASCGRWNSHTVRWQMLLPLWQMK